MKLTLDIPDQNFSRGTVQEFLRVLDSFNTSTALPPESCPFGLITNPENILSGSWLIESSD